MLLLAHLMTRSPFWHQARLRVLTAIQDEDPAATAEALKLTLEQSRIKAEAVVVADFTSSTIIQHSADASLVFLPLVLKAGQLVDCAGEAANQLLSQLPLVALVVAAQQIELDAEPEEGAAGLLAEAEDRYSASLKRVKQAEEEAQELNLTIDAELKGLMEARQKGGDEKEVQTHYEALAKSRQELTKAIRRSAKAEAKLDQEEQQIEQLRKKYHLNEEPEES